MIRFFIIFSLSLVSMNTNAETEYYHCDKDIDTYWKFDVDNMDQIDPFASPVVMRKLFYNVPYYDVSYNDEWFLVSSVVEYALGIAKSYYFINRKGKESWRRVRGEELERLGICKQFKPENPEEFFKLAPIEEPETDDD